MASEMIQPDLGDGAAIAHQINVILEQIGGLQEQIGGFQEQLQERIEDLSAEMHACFFNLYARSNNRREQWTPLVVEHPGTNPIGQPPPDHPLNEAAVCMLTSTQIIELAVQFNLPPDHFEGGNLGIRRSNVRRYLTLG